MTSTLYLYNNGAKCFLSVSLSPSTLDIENIGL